MSDVVMIGDDLWTLGPPIGSGGFGEVRLAESSGQLRAMKLVPKDPGADRELLFADDLRGVAKVIPVLGTGETADMWAILMPLAEMSLRQHLNDSGGALMESAALSIIASLCEALIGVSDARVIHRDVKPENILLYNNEWCLSDFGVSRYVDAVTSTDTMRYSMTKPYAAPEQWRDEEPSTATDIYALGVVAYELLQGSRPFCGPNFRDQHLHQQPSPMTGITPSLAALVDECLFKDAGARPSALNLFTRLQSRSARKDDSAGFTALHEANRKATAEASSDHQRQSKLRSEQERRTALFDAARRQLAQIGGELREALLQAAPRISQQQPDRENWELTLGHALIQFSQAFPNNIESRAEREVRKRRSGLDPALPPFDVIAYATISVSSRRSHNERVGRARSLWFCDAKESGTYRWYEDAFPDSASPLDRLMHEALRVKVGNSALAWPFTVLQPGQLDDFVDRWAGWLAECAEETLKPPVRKPPSEQKAPGTPRTDRVPGMPEYGPPSYAVQQTVPRGKRVATPTVLGIIAVIAVISCVAVSCFRSDPKFDSPMRTYFKDAKAVCEWSQPPSTQGWAGCQASISDRQSPVIIRFTVTGITIETWQMLTNLKAGNTSISDGCVARLSSGRSSFQVEHRAEGSGSTSKLYFQRQFQSVGELEAAQLQLKFHCGNIPKLAAEFDFQISYAEEIS